MECFIGLKRVTAEMQTHKNPTLREGPAPFKTNSSSQVMPVSAPVDKPAKFLQEGKKWLIVCISN